MLFSGDVRSNLDPFQEHSDELIWEALKAVQMAGAVFAHGQGLYLRVKSEGTDLSFGQRQLLCVARMILRQPGLLLLDECTSAIDPHTQELVQSSIRSSFPNSTLCVVAHRLDTIMDFDMVVVLDNGRIVEQGTVQTLKHMEKGHFSRMLHAARSPMNQRFRDVTKVNRTVVATPQVEREDRLRRCADPSDPYQGAQGIADSARPDGAPVDEDKDILDLLLPDKFAS